MRAEQDTVVIQGQVIANSASRHCAAFLVYVPGRETGVRGRLQRRGPRSGLAGPRGGAVARPAGRRSMRSARGAAARLAGRQAARWPVRLVGRPPVILDRPETATEQSRCNTIIIIIIIINILIGHYRLSRGSESRFCAGLLRGRCQRLLRGAAAGLQGRPPGRTPGWLGAGLAAGLSAGLLARMRERLPGRPTTGRSLAL
jgi:hypothetical protein